MIDDVAFQSAVSRVFESLNDEFRRMVVTSADRLMPVCESPIELMLGSTMVCIGMIMDTTSRDSPRPFLRLGDPDSANDCAEITVIPQYRWEGYRIDFAIRARLPKNLIVFIECDGHEFHKDRKIQEAGIPILRFTGREIYRSPSYCVINIFEFLSKRLKG